MDELNRFLEENQEPLAKVLSSVELPAQISPREVEYFRKWRDDYKAEWGLIEKAMEYGVSKGRGQVYRFADAVLKIWLNDGVKTPEELEEYTKKQQKQYEESQKYRNRSTRNIDTNRPPHDPHYSRSGLVKLLPCPFCGSEDVVVTNQFSSKHNAYYTVVECVRCKASTRPSENFTDSDPASESFWMSESVQEVAKLWNMRV